MILLISCITINIQNCINSAVNAWSRSFSSINSSSSGSVYNIILIFWILSNCSSVNCTPVSLCSPYSASSVRIQYHNPCYQNPLYLVIVFGFCDNSSGYWSATLFLGDFHHFNVSLWSDAANVSKYRSKICPYAWRMRANSGSSGSAWRMKWWVLITLCLGWLKTSFHWVYCNYESASIAGAFPNNANRRSFAWPFHALISCIIWSSMTSWLLSSPFHEL